jgi:hypothetical protein
VERTRPPRSPDVIPLDVYLWSQVKSKVYRRKLDTRVELLDHIMEVFGRIKERQDALRRATRHVLSRVARYIDVDSGIFESILY